MEYSEDVELCWQFFKVAISVKHTLMKIAEKYDLTVMQLYALCILESNKSLPMHSFCGSLHCDPSNVTVIVDHLFARDYVKREENPKDRREKMITITSEGRALCKKISKEISSYQPGFFTSLSKEEKRQLLNLIKTLTTLQ